MTFDREHTIDAMARASYETVASAKGLPFEPWETLPVYWRMTYKAQADVATPIIVRAVTDEIRSGHVRYYRSTADEVWRPETSGYCAACECDWPCVAVAQCDQIDAAAGVER